MHGIQDKILGLVRNTTLFPIGDEALYFESEEGACEMVKLHFPGDICTGKINFGLASYLYFVHIGDFLPKPNDEVYDIESDEALSRIAFYGIGQIYLRAGSEKQTYEINLSFMKDLEQREGYERMGANAIFDNEMNVLEIILPSTDEGNNKVNIFGFFHCSCIECIY